MNIQDLLQGSLGQEAQQVVAQQLGLNPTQAADAVSLALPTLLNALSNNAATQDGASSLFNAISNKHNGSGLNDLVGLAQVALGGEGNAILKHILGGKQPKIEEAISQNTGLAGGQAAQILQILAPIILNALGKQQSTQGLDAGGLAGILAQVVGGMKQQQSPQQKDILTQLLDQNNDGNIIDDALKMGGGLLGKLFKK